MSGERGGDGGAAPAGRGDGGGSDEVDACMLGGVLIGEGGGEACKRRFVRREERKAGGQESAGCVVCWLQGQDWIFLGAGAAECMWVGRVCLYQLKS